MRMSFLLPVLLAGTVQAGAAHAAPTPEIGDNAGAILGYAEGCHMDQERLEKIDKAALKRLVDATPVAEKDEALMTYASEKSQGLARQLSGDGVDCKQVEAAIGQLEAIRPIKRPTPSK